LVGCATKADEMSRLALHASGTTPNSWQGNTYTEKQSSMQWRHYPAILGPSFAGVYQIGKQASYVTITSAAQSYGQSRMLPPPTHGLSARGLRFWESSTMRLPQVSSMGIATDSPVLGEDGGVLLTRSGHDNLVGWIVMKWLRQTGGLEGDRGRKCNQSKFRHREGFIKPLFGAA
jgi:hypothetical protein